KRAYCLKTQPATGETYPKSDLFNKAEMPCKKLNQFLTACLKIPVFDYRHHLVHAQRFRNV
ncbi:hypothetical protein ACLHXY_13090, partial [Klebsiella quasipneumoniae]|uniref:hypothetical protein n=1 Tax=Klebsiella quasipneumoniae TaxID=1463165 RepID=UPI003982E863